MTGEISLQAEALSRIYDGFAPAYDQGRSLFDNSAQLERLAGRIPLNADVLDAGCGSGAPVLRFFSERGCRVTGTDVSPAMLQIAAGHVPSARLVEADSASLDFEAESFDLIVSFYSLFHLPVDNQLSAFAHFHRLLRPGGLAYFTLAAQCYTGAAEFSGSKAFAGVNLPYHHVTPESYQRVLENTGFFVETMDELLIGGETMLWVLAGKK